MKRVASFASAFKEGYYCDIDVIREAVIIKVFFNIIDHESGYKADFVILKINTFRQVEFKRRQVVDLWGKKVFAVTEEDLLISKLIWIQELQSPVQMEDIKFLGQSKTIDRNYVDGWVKKLELKTFSLL